jgi:hypothetical protein
MASAFNPARFAVCRRGAGKGLFVNLALWLLLGPAALAAAEGNLFAPQTRAEPPRAEVIEAPLRASAPAPTARPRERTYFQIEENAPESPPYWLEREDRDDAPYWLVREPARESARPYWEPAPERVEIIAHTVEPAFIAQPPLPGPAGGPLTISYFMYQDESGIKHLSNVPDDPRYREFTVTVDIKVQRGLAGARTGRLRFTHESLRPIILRAARVYNLDPALIAAVIKSESAFDANAVSWAGAQGLMQLMPGTARDMDCADPFDPDQNIMAGSRYLRLMLDAFGGDLTLALASYNSGPERVKRHWRVPNIPETRNYVLIVSRNYERYKGQL